MDRSRGGYRIDRGLCQEGAGLNPHQDGGKKVFLPKDATPIPGEAQVILKCISVMALLENFT